MSDTGYRMLRAGARGWPREMLWRGRVYDFNKVVRKGRILFIYFLGGLFLLFLFFFFIFTLFYFAILYWFCHTLTRIYHGCTCFPKHEPPSHLPPQNIPLGHPRAPAPSMLYPALDIDWQFDSYMIVYMFQCHSPKSSHPLPLPLSPKVRYTHLCLFCCLAYRVVIAIPRGIIVNQKVMYYITQSTNSIIKKIRKLRVRVKILIKFIMP